MKLGYKLMIINLIISILSLIIAIFFRFTNIDIYNILLYVSMIFVLLNFALMIIERNS